MELKASASELALDDFKLDAGLAWRATVGVRGNAADGFFHKFIGLLCTRRDLSPSEKCVASNVENHPSFKTDSALLLNFSASPANPEGVVQIEPRALRDYLEMIDFDLSVRSTELHVVRALIRVETTKLDYSVSSASLGTD
jgi:hypothetical protein